MTFFKWRISKDLTIGTSFDVTHYNRIRIYGGNKAREKFTFMNFALLIIEFETPIFSGIEPTRRFRGRQATLRPFPSLFFFFL